MATGYRIDGLDLEEGYYISVTDTLIPFEWADENDVVSPEYVLSMFSSNRYRRNGQPIKQAVGKVLIKTPPEYGIMYEPYPQLPNCRAKFKVSGVSDSDERIGAKGQTPHGRLVASFTEAGEHTIDLSDDGYILVDGQKTDIYIANVTKTQSNGGVISSGIRNFSFLLVGGGGGGAGSGLTYCSAGGGGGAVTLSSYQALYERDPSAWKRATHNFPIKINVAAGGAGGGAQSAGQAGGVSYAGRVSRTHYAGGGSGGGTNDAAGGVGGESWYDWCQYISNGGTGGNKESNGSANIEVECSKDCFGYNKEDILSKYGVRIHNGGASNGNNYGGGGGASALADGAPANSKGAGVNGTLGAGGSGAGFTAFSSNGGGKGGDGAVYVFY